MAIELGKDIQQTPNVRFRAIGQQFVGMVVDELVRPAKVKDQRTGELVVKTRNDGSAVNEHVLTVMVMDGTSTPVGSGSVDRAAQPGELVRWILSGRVYGQEITAYGQEGLNRRMRVGDVVTGYQFGAVFYDGRTYQAIGTTTSQEEVNARRLQPGGGTIGADIAFSARGAESHEQHLVAQAEAHYHRLHPPTELGQPQPQYQQQPPAYQPPAQPQYQPPASQYNQPAGPQAQQYAPQQFPPQQPPAQRRSAADYV